MANLRARAVFVQFTISAVFLNAETVQATVYQKLSRAALECFRFSLKSHLKHFYDFYQTFFEDGLSQNMSDSDTLI